MKDSFLREKYVIIPFVLNMTEIEEKMKSNCIFFK